jgi:hypothetical protein
MLMFFDSYTGLPYTGLHRGYVEKTKNRPYSLFALGIPTLIKIKIKNFWVPGIGYET